MPIELPGYCLSCPHLLISFLVRVGHCYSHQRNAKNHVTKIEKIASSCFPKLGKYTMENRRLMRTIPILSPEVFLCFYSFIYIYIYICVCVCVMQESWELQVPLTQTHKHMLRFLLFPISCFSIKTMIVSLLTKWPVIHRNSDQIFNINKIPKCCWCDL